MNAVVPFLFATVTEQVTAAVSTIVDRVAVVEVGTVVEISAVAAISSTADVVTKGITAILIDVDRIVEKNCDCSLDLKVIEWPPLTK